MTLLSDVLITDFRIHSPLWRGDHAAGDSEA